MNHYRLPIICLILVSVVVTAFSQETVTNNWHPNTKLLDAFAGRPDPINKDTGSTLAHDVKRFYELLRDKKWHETYELHSKAFRADALETDYIATGLKHESTWGLVNYEVLSIQTENSIGSTNIDEATLICKFTELPGHSDSYSTVFWHKEEGVWKCLSAGPHKLIIFSGTRGPIIDWR